MAVDMLQHINIHVADLERSKQFYTRVLGLRVGPRPPVASVGHWLYLDDRPVIHLVEKTAGGLLAAPNSAIDHVAFHGTDLEATRRLLHADGVTFHETVIPRDGSIQLFVHDPDGVKIELNFDPPWA
jgi:catechol 2,3-dioxygenase-like lactoylglutathione lyase family enzyme